MKAWRLLREDGVSAGHGLAVDETLASRVVQGAPPTLRLYTYRPHSALIGRFQDAANEVHLAYCAAHGLEVNRRPTGGGAILMGPDQLGVALTVPEKLARYAALDVAKANLKAQFTDEELDEKGGEISEHFSGLKASIVRGRILNDGVRIDKRGITDIRAISTETTVLPRTHGSALFTRGETQALATVTLGTGRDPQRIETLMGEVNKSFMLHYNFPPFSVGETKFLRGPGRREIGHGTLAQRGITPLLPSEESFPYAIRIVSEVLESNGSSSMATVCAGSMALMDAGVPISGPVAGIAMG